MDNITLIFDLPFDGLCLFLEGTMFMKELTQMLVSESARYKSRRIPSRCSLFSLKRLNCYDRTDQSGFPVAWRTDYCTLWEYLYNISWLNVITLPEQLTVLLSRREVSYFFFFNQRITVASLVSFFIFLTLFVSNMYFVIMRDMKYNKNGIRYRLRRKCVCRIMLWKITVIFLSSYK